MFSVNHGPTYRERDRPSGDFGGHVGSLDQVMVRIIHSTAWSILDKHQIIHQPTKMDSLIGIRVFCQTISIVKCFKSINRYMYLHQQSQVAVVLHYKRKRVTDPFVCCDVTKYSLVFTVKNIYIFCSQLSCQRLRRHVTSRLCHCVGSVDMAA